jgi:hypothetical protein
MFLFLAALLAAPSDTPANFKPRTDTFDYIRREEMIPLHDGVKLKTFIHPEGREPGADIDDPDAIQRFGEGA